MVSDRDPDRGSSQKPPVSVSPDAGAIAMTSVVRITHLFAEARENCTKVAGTPNDDHFVAFKEYLQNLCLQITFEGTNAGAPTTAGPQGIHIAGAPASFMNQSDGHFGALLGGKHKEPVAQARHRVRRQRLPPQACRPDLAPSAEKLDHLIHQGDTSRDALRAHHFHQRPRKG